MYESRLVHVAHRRAKTSPALPNIHGLRVPVIGHIALVALSVGLVPAVAVRADSWGTWAHWFIGAGFVSAVIGRALTRGSTLYTQLLDHQIPTTAAVFGQQPTTMYRRYTSYHANILVAGCVLSIGVAAALLWIDRPFVLTASFIRHRLDHAVTIAGIVIALALIAEAAASCSAWFNLVEGRLQVARNVLAFVVLPALALTFLAGWSGEVLGGYRSIFASLGEVVISGTSIDAVRVLAWLGFCGFALFAHQASAAGAVRAAAQK